MERVPRVSEPVVTQTLTKGKEVYPEKKKDVTGWLTQVLEEVTSRRDCVDTEEMVEEHQ